MNTNNNNQQTTTTTTTSSTNIKTQQIPNAFTLTEGTTAQQIIDHLKIPEGDDKSNISKFNLNGSSLLNPEVTLDILIRTLGISLPTALSLLALRTTTPSGTQVEQDLSSHKRKLDEE
ncbi:RING zinc finger-containing protein [Tieghemostelium lacteum]|uniref:RING zinc finger-containing protein n=1 Tax=Tieghemostelium lacteum TaxID=361077 RepID=A0A151Z329_TIELA|nr:RING zinc finger-containing protein [Tieghemostelium lacteum]|eukprot:KYQ88366.1 RING zinc finger-containing protein [Tieghemostelium lacteum]